METERITLNQRERGRLRVLHEIKGQQISQIEAAQRLKISDRHIRRLLIRLRKLGDRAVLHGLRRRSSNVILEAFRHGAKGLVCRTESVQALSRCIRGVHLGQVCINSEQMEVLLRALIETRPPASPFEELLCSPKEKRTSPVWWPEGLTNREVAKRLGLSEHTVGNYLFKCYEKLGLSTCVEFVLYVLGQRPNRHAAGSVIEVGTTVRAE